MTPPPLPSSSSAAAPPPPHTRRYSVLYYKRSFSSSSTNKNRGNTARSDGILTISPPPSCVVKLTSSDDNGNVDIEEESDDDECNDDTNNSDDDDEGGTCGAFRGSTKKQKWNKFKNKRQQTAQKKKLKQQKLRPNSIVWRGVNADLSRRAYSDFQPDAAGTSEMRGGMSTTMTMIRDDDTLLLNGQWACEIVCLLDNHSDAVATTYAASSLGGRSNGLLNNGSTMMNKQESSSSNSLVGANGTGSTTLAMPPARAPLSSMRANVIQPLRSKKTGLGTGLTLPPKRVVGLGAAPSHASVCQSVTTPALPAAASSAAGVVRVDMGGTKRQKDAADGKHDQSESDDSDHRDENETNAKTSSYKIPPSLLRSTSSTVANCPRTVPTTTTTTTTLGSSLSSSHFPTSTTIRGNIRTDASSKSSSNITDFPGAKGERINVPASLRNVLRPHQREGIAFLWNCVTGVNEGLKNAYYSAAVGSASGSVGGDENEDEEDDGDVGRRSTVTLPAGGVVPRGAVLADEMGLGKTLMTIATIFAYHRLHRDRRFIVVCPSSLVSNWSKEFDKWLGKASQPKRIAVRNGAESEGLRNLKSFVPLKSNQSEVLILSYEIFRLHVKVIHKAKQIGILVVDEGHRLKNTSGSQILTALNSIDVEARILISGTPIQNNLSEFYNVSNFAVPGILGELSSFRRLYERPMSQANQKNASTVQRDNGRRQSKALDAITSQFVLRRTQKDILKSLLPPRTEVLLFCRPTERQCELYQSIAQRASKSIGSIGGIEDCNNPLMLLTELRKLCTHPSLLDNTDAVADASLSGKLAVLSNLLDSIRRHNPMDKVVIVSNFTSALTVIERSILRKTGLTFLRLDGSTDNKSRGALVDAFNNFSVEHSFAFLLSSKAGGCGLNLIGANRLICVDADWNPSTDLQAMARVYRQGQTKPCYIYRMFTTGTVEEVIYQRQLQKGNLAKLANDGGSKKIDKDSSSFTKDELRDCFTLKRSSKCDTKQKLGSKWSDYAGDSTLRSHGCEDEPLLEICEDYALTFVHIVDNDEKLTTTVDGGRSDGEVSSADDDLSESESSVPGDDRPSSEEEEFHG